jgi:hypothetical protein
MGVGKEKFKPRAAEFHWMNSNFLATADVI